MTAMTIRRLLPCAAFLLAFALPAAPVRAQGQDPMREIQEIARRVAEQLQEIDRLLLESSDGKAEGRPLDKLQRSREQSETVEQGIDELIEKLTEMKGRSGQQSSQQDQQQQQQQDSQEQGGQPQQGQQRPGQRREGTTPEFDGQQQQQQQQQGNEDQQTGQRPRGGEQNPEGGENREAQAMPESPTGPGQPGEGEGQWGGLQQYQNDLKNRGVDAKVPEKFRKYWEAYLEAQKQRK